jgi:hypothetical protein
MKKNTAKSLISITILLLISVFSYSQVVLEKEVKITDLGLHFDGSKVGITATNSGDNAPYDYFFGRTISAKGDCIKTYNQYVFMTWYRGGKEDRHVMLTRYNTTTGISRTIEFPHRHTGYHNKYWIGESHNAIAVEVSPLDGTIHLLYDMHAYGRTRPTDGSLSKDYFRYSYSIKDAASLPDPEFTLDKFVQNKNGGYKHLSLNSGKSGYPDEEYSKYSFLTYPQFFTNDLGDIFMYMREGGNSNGAYKFSKYDANTSTWSDFTHFNVLNAKNQGAENNWGLYGNMKYVDGKIRIGFQRRENKVDKYQYQNGVYYAYSNDQSGASGWKNYQGQSFNLPLYDADFIKVIEPGDYVQTTQTDKVHIVGDFDWTVTANGDVHIISKVKDNENNVTKYLHTYKPANAANFITTEDFSGASSIYTAGNDVFIVGLKNDRIFIQKTEGGTNNFKTVYQATSGKTFDHGRVHIKNGKLYYYLMEKKSGNAQPLYLQIIDLDIIKEPFRVSLKSPIDGETYFVNETTSLSAEAIDENGSISKVEFKLDGSYVGEDDTEPYSINWTIPEEGFYSIQALAYNADNNTVSSNTITVNAVVFNPTDLAEKIYRLKNVATGKYLKSVGSNLEASDYVANDESLNWKFVKTNIASSEYYNIDSEVNGVLRGAGSGVGNTIISTSRSSPNSDVDKVWTSNYIEAEDVYRFAVKDGKNYLYHQDDNQFYNIVADSNDARSKWQLELASNTPLSIEDNIFKSTSIKLYPNPTKNEFTLEFFGFTNAEVIIYDVLGKSIYSNKIDSKRLQITNKNKFKPSIYLVKVIDEFKKVYHKKLIIE